MNENFGNGFENRENRFNSEKAEQVDFIPAQDEQEVMHTPAADDVSFTAQEKPVFPEETAREEEPVQPPVNPIYSNQTYSNYGYGNYQYSQPQAPIQKPAVRKGIKIFAVLIALVVVFSLGAGVATIVKYSDGKQSDEISNQEIANGAPDIDIHESPVSPTNITLEGALTTSQVAAKVKSSIVGVVVYANNNSNSTAGEGTGVIMGEDDSRTYTYIITCAHVISDAGIKARIQTEDGTTYDAEIVGFDTRTDLGVLRIKASGLKAAEFGNSDSLNVGDPVYAVGNPGGVEFFGSFTGGFVSAIDRPVSSEIGYTMKCIQHDAAINPGNSGGALVNSYGQVIGINSQKIAATEYEGMGFAIPITSAKGIIEDLIKYNYVPDRPMLGITYYPVSASQQYSMIAQIKGLPAGTLIINEISPDSSLANTTARQYDMIIAVDGQPLTTADVLLEKIDNGKVGDTFTLTLCRVNSNYTIEEFKVEAKLVEDKGGSEPITTTVQYLDPFEYFNQFGFGY